MAPTVHDLSFEFDRQNGNLLLTCIGKPRLHVVSGPDLSVRVWCEMGVDVVRASIIGMYGPSVIYWQALRF